MLLVEEKIKHNISLKELSTYKIGGAAKHYISVKSKEELTSAIAWADKNKEKFFIIGGGSNLLINDKGINGLVIKISNNDVIPKGERIETGAGASLAQVVRTAANISLAGLEWGIGIPGTIGGAIRGNAGAFGSSISEIIETTECLNKGTGKFILFSRRDCIFEYKNSIFKKNNNYIIWQASLKLTPGNQDNINNLINKYINKRRLSEPKLPSAGCIFKNINADSLKKRNKELYSRAKEENAVKGGMISTGWIIDRLDLKGKTIGDAKVSLEHANFIVNISKASSEDVIILINLIKEKVRNNLNISLEEEIQYFGF